MVSETTDSGNFIKVITSQRLGLVVVLMLMIFGEEVKYLMLKTNASNFKAGQLYEVG